MGGKALKNTITRRYQKDEFEKLSKEIIPKIERSFGTKASLVKSFHSKESFGDMDILLMSLIKDKDFLRKISNINQILKEDFGANEIFSNGNCISFDYKKLQIDLILTSFENWEIANVFYSYNDLGNLMGKIYHKFNLKYGFDGLKYIHRKNDQKLGTYIVSKNPRKIFDFICLDYDRFLKGFETIEDVFDYVIGSKFFNAESFKFENLNAINRRRNKRRPNYNAFIEYVKDVDKKFEFNKDKDSYLPIIDAFFPEANLLDKIQKSEEEFKRLQFLNSHFNGKLIMKRHPELQGKELGAAIKGFKEKIEKERPFNNYLEGKISSSNQHEIMQDFDKFLADKN